MNVLTGDRMSTQEFIDKLQSNIAFRVTSARDMLTSIRGESAMNPLDRRRQIRQNRLELLGFTGDEDVSAGHVDESPAEMSEDSTGSGRISGTRNRGGNGGDTSVSHDVPSMDEVNRGTKRRAEDNGFYDS